MFQVLTPKALRLVVFVTCTSACAASSIVLLPPATLTTKTISFSLPLRRFARTATFENKLKCADSLWLRGLRRGSAAARLLGLRVRNPLGYGCLSDVSKECCQVQVTVTSLSLTQRSLTERVGVSERGQMEH